MTEGRAGPGSYSPTPYDLLGQFPDRTRPFVTHYQGRDARVELSVASVANAMAKACSMLRDGLDVRPGAVVSVDLPRHWQLPVWGMAALSVGATLGRELADPVDVRIVGPRGLAQIVAGADPRADEVLACSCDAFGLPIPGGTPIGVIDVGVEVRAHPDVFSPAPGAGAAAALLVAGAGRPRAAGRQAWAEMLRHASPQPVGRAWVDEATPESALLMAVVVQPLLARGSVVIGMGLTPEEAAHIRSIEGVTGRAGG